MKRECEYCGYQFDGHLNECPKCGATEFKQHHNLDNFDEIDEMDLEMEEALERNQHYFDKPAKSQMTPEQKKKQNDDIKKILYIIIGIYGGITILRFLAAFFSIFAEVL